jgi:hypothetical protein
MMKKTNSPAIIYASNGRACPFQRACRPHKQPHANRAAQGDQFNMTSLQSTLELRFFSAIYPLVFAFPGVMPVIFIK